VLAAEESAHSMAPTDAAAAGSIESSPGARAARWLAELAFWGTAAWLLLHRLGDFPLKDWDEAIYAEVVRELLRTGDWLTMHYNHDVYFNKPPLYFWLAQAPMRLFGFSEWSSRLPGVLFGAATLWQTRRWGDELGGRLAGMVAGLVLLTSGMFLENGSRHATPDSLLLLLSVAALRSQWLARRGSRPRWLAPLLLGLAVLTKGAAAIALLATLLAIHVLLADHRRWSRRDYLLGAAACCLPVLPWYLAQTLVNGEAFWLKHGYWSVWQRLTVAGAPAATHAHGPAFYLEFLASHLRHLWPVGVLAAMLALPSRAGAPAGRPAAAAAATREAGITLAAASAVTVLLFSLSRNKAWWYVLPAIPPLALLCGLVARAAWERLGGRRWRAAALLALLAVQAALLAREAQATLAGQVANGQRAFGTLAYLARAAEQASRERGLARPILVFPRESPTVAVYVSFPVVIDPACEERLAAADPPPWPPHDGAFLIVRAATVPAPGHGQGPRVIAERSGWRLVLTGAPQAGDGAGSGDGETAQPTGASRPGSRPPASRP
jgi:4-amino-4-deoxy-L-arabinose transferase-like glycosyltransferase